MVKSHRIQVGDSHIDLVELAGGNGPRFIHVHRNELAAVAAARSVVESGVGHLFSFAGDPERCLTFSTGGDMFRFDPNRIFSDPGIESTLMIKSGAAPEVAIAAVRSFRTQLLALWRMEAAPAVIAVHNTRDDYSIRSYLTGGSEAPNAADVFVKPELHQHDFFFVTTPADFNHLRDAGFNVALQATSPVDDGSMSVYCARRGIRYINVEARFDAVDAQRKMIAAALKATAKSS